MATKEIQLGTKGVPVKLTITGDTPTGTPLFRFQDPEGTNIEFDGVLSPGDTWVAAYQLQDGDGVAELAGDWRWQVYLQFLSGWKGWSPVKAFKVLHNLG